MATKKPTIQKTKTIAPKLAVAKQPKDKFLIVGIGASAGGLEAFKSFFESLPSNPGMAFIVVQHLDPTHKSMLSDLLSKYTKMKVMEVKDRTKVEPDHVYVIPPNKDMAILDGVLHLMTPVEERGHRRPIDFFLKSLADDQKERAVGIIFSGTGTEGAISLKKIKGEGGLTLVQDPTTAKFDGMPRSVVTAGAADFILKAKAMPEQLIKYMANLNINHLINEPKTIIPTNVLEKIFILLRNSTGCNFNNYKGNTIIRRIEKRMAINQIEKLDDYLKYLQKTPEEVHLLFKELLIGVTNFFRDSEAFEDVNKKAISHIIKQKLSGDIIRVWTAGCSTGEEAYSLAMLFNEAISKQKKDLRLQLFASDIDEDAINRARVGIYTETIAADVNPSRLQRFFKVEKQAYRIKKEVRDQVIFAVHNILKDTPFSKLDMISCRNLLIYLNTEAQQKIFATFHYSLNPNGILFLGNSESLGECSDFFTTLDRKHKLFLRKNVKLGINPKIDFSITNIAAHKIPISLAKTGKPHFENIGGITERLLLSKYGPACCIINRKDDAVYFSGNTGKYLQPSPGEARFNVVDMAREGLKSDLRIIIAKARKTNKQEERNDVKVKTDDNLETIKLKVMPFIPFESNEKYLMIIFEELSKDVIQKSITKANTSKLEHTSEINALEQELHSTKEYLRSTIEELEVSNEELKSSNEELQSSNEEMQSTNEELETSKEELQSLNEEMITMNNELQEKIDELAHSYNDMNNLLSSTEIAIIFLDRKLIIRRFTPATANIIHLIPSDIGRPLNDLSSNLYYHNLVMDSKEVLDKLVPIKKNVESNNNTWYQMQISPYLTSTNLIDGVVLTFVDITEEKYVQETLIKTKEQYEELMKHTNTLIYEQDKHLKYTKMVNSPPHYSIEDVIGKTDKELLMHKEEAEILEKLKKKVIRNKIAERREVMMTLNSKETYFDLMVRPVTNDKNEITGIVCIATDITDFKNTENNLAQIKLTNET